jgi:hypothetical protein
MTLESFQAILLAPCASCEMAGTLNWRLGTRFDVAQVDLINFYTLVSPLFVGGGDIPARVD